MNKQPTGRRVPVEETAPDDAFIARILELSSWAQRNLRAVIIGGLALVMLVTGGLYYRNQQAAVRTEASIELMNLRMASAQLEEQQLVAELQNFLARYRGTGAADEARIMLGQAFLQLGRAEEAVPLLEEQARRPDRPLGATAAFLLAAAFEEMERIAEAEEVLIRIADRGDLGFQKRDALDQAARIRLDRSDAAGAAALYERLVASFEGDEPERSFYEMRLAETRALARSAASGS